MALFDTGTRAFVTCLSASRCVRRFLAVSHLGGWILESERELLCVTRVQYSCMASIADGGSCVFSFFLLLFSFF